MPSRLNPYLNFDGQAREAVEFYKTVLGGTLDMTTYQQGGMADMPDNANKIMHAMLEASNGMVLMASDVPDGSKHTVGNNISVSLSGDDEAELKGYWDKLSDGAVVDMPLMNAPWGDQFGMLTDKFGVRWMVNITGKK